MNCIKLAHTSLIAKCEICWVLQYEKLFCTNVTTYSDYLMKFIQVENTSTVCFAVAQELPPDESP